jgi:hypothetical protein
MAIKIIVVNRFIFMMLSLIFEMKSGSGGLEREHLWSGQYLGALFAIIMPLVLFCKLLIVMCIFIG